MVYKKTIKIEGRKFKGNELEKVHNYWTNH
jgi:hypothetical protein